MKTLDVKITLTQPILGSLPLNKELYQDYIEAKTVDKPDVEMESKDVPEVLEKGTTGFLRDENGLYLLDYQVRGFIKGNIGILIELGECAISKWSYKRVIDNCVFIKPRKVYFKRDGGFIKLPDGICERPLRCETMQGDRVALSRSEMINEGATMEFSIEIFTSTNKKSKFSELNMDLIKQCLDRGSRIGLGQWRSGGYGAFAWDAKG